MLSNADTGRRARRNLQSLAASVLVMLCITACGGATSGPRGAVVGNALPATSSATSRAEHFQAAAGGPYQPHTADLYVNGTVCVSGQGCTGVDGRPVPAPGGGWACDANAAIVADQPHYAQMIAPAATVTAWADRDASDDAAVSSVVTSDEYCPGLPL